MGVHYNRGLTNLAAVVLMILLFPLVVYGLPGDLNGSGRVDGYDLIILGQAYGASPSDPKWNPDADLNQDGIVDQKDLEILSAHFGRNGISFGLWAGSISGTERIFKLSSTGNMLQKLTGFSTPVSISGNLNDNTVWVADSSSDQVIQLSGFDGEQKIAVSGMDPYAVCVDPRDGAVWVADYAGKRVVKLLPDIADGYSIATDTGSHLVVNGFTGPKSISVNPVTGVVWVADSSGNKVIRLLPDVADGYHIGSDLGSHTTKTGFRNPLSISVNSVDGTAWVADAGNKQVVKLSATGTTEIVRVGGFTQPRNLDTSSVDGSVWIADYANDQVVRLAADGSLICRVDGFLEPYAVSVNSLDGSAWVADYYNDQVVHLSPNGTEQLRISGISRPQTVAVIADHGTAGRYPVASAETDKNNVAAEEVINFIGTANDPDGTIRLYEWDFDGDGTIDFSSTTTGITTHSYAAEGLYNPVFRVTDNDWLTATNYSQIVRVGELKAFSTADVLSGTAPLEVNFSGSFVDPIDGFVDSYQWDFDGDNVFDSFSATSPDAKKTFLTAGTYTVVFKVTDGNHSALDQLTIQVEKASPTVTATATPAVGPLPLRVGFSGSASDPDGSILLYEWDFDGDGVYDWSSTQTPDTFFIYHTAGLYTARLKVTDNDGLTSTATVDIDAGTTVVPFAAVAGADKTSGRAPITVNFNAAGSSGDDIVTYEWRFGDGSLFSDSMDTDSGNWQADASSWALVQTEYHSKPSSWTNAPGGNYPDNANHSLTSVPLDLSGVSSATLSFWHRYQTQYYDYCRVEISVNGGSSWSQLGYSYYGTLATWTKVSFDISSYLPNSDVRIRFRFTSDGSSTGDGWYIDDVQINSDETDWTETADGTISYTYDQSGIFSAELRLTDSAGTQKTDSIEIQVDPVSFPDATADAAPKTGETPLTVSFTASATDSDGTVASYAWNFGEDYVWVADQSNDTVVRLYQDGSGEMARVSGFNDPYAVSINPDDGTVWVADYYNHAVVRLSANGQTELLRATGFSYPASVSVDPSDSSVWIADQSNNQVVNLASDGRERVRAGGFYRPQGIAVNTADGSVWVADTGNHQVVKLSSSGSGLVRVSGFNNPLGISVNSTDGTIWVANTTGDTVVRLAADIRDGYHIDQDTGSHLVCTGFNDPYSVAVNTSDSSVWVADYYNNQLVHLAADGSELLRTGGFSRPTGVAVNSSDSSVWVADYNNNQVVHLSASGQVLNRLGGFNRPRAVAVADTGAANLFTSSTTGNTTHTYTMPGQYHAVFTATDNDGNQAQESVDITVFGSPQVVASADIDSGSAPLEVFLTAQVTELSGTVVRHEWDFDGDGIYESESATTPNVRHVFPVAGTYVATIRVTTDIGYSSTDSVTITVAPVLPKAHAAAAPVRGNVPLAVTFSGTATDSDGSIVKYEWDFDGDGTFDSTSSDMGDAAYSYSTAGTYTAVLRVTDNDGQTDTDTVTIVAEPASTPRAFIYTPSAGGQGIAPYNTRFYLHGIDPDGTIANVEIDFDGDGTFETVQPTAFGDNMETGEAYWTADGSWARTLTDAHSPSYCWTDSPDGNYLDNANMALTSSTIDLSSAIAPKLVFWHKYAFKSSDYGYIEISANDGGSWSSLKSISNATQNSWVKEEFSLASYAGNATVKIRFRLTSNASDTADGWYIDDVWVGDGIEHTYAAHGEYTVSLRVTDNEGNTSTAQQTVSVMAAENAATIWVADYSNRQVVKLSDMGDVLARVKGFNYPRAVEVNPVTGNAWVADTNNNQIVKLSKDVSNGYDVTKSFALDDSSVKNPGALFGNTVLAETGQLNKGFYFDGSGDYIEIPDNPAYRMTSWTLEAWVQPENLSGNRTILGKVSQGKDLALMMTGDKISALVYSAGARQYVTAAESVTIGQWYHVAATYDEATGMVRLYVDGAFKGEKAVTPDTSNTDPLMIGRSNCCSEYFYGTIDDVRVWNVARTQAQITGARLSELTGSENGLVGYWKLNLVSTPYHETITNFNSPYAISVNTADNSAWVADRSNHSIAHLSSDGTVIRRIYGFYNPSEVAVNSATGSIWVSDTSNDRVIKLPPDVMDGYVVSATGLTADASSYNNPGMLVGDTLLDTGKFDNSMRFDGSGDYLVIPSDAALDVQNFTVEAWVNSSYVTGRTIFMRGDNTGGNELYFGFSNATTIEAIVDNVSSVSFSGAVDFTDGEWHHVALVYDSSTLTCYVDGAVYGTPVSRDVTLDFGDSQALIGADFDSFNGSLGNYFNGRIDDVRLWNIARTQAQISAAKDAELTGSEPGLAGYWKLNQVSDPQNITVITGFNDPYGLSIDLSDNGIWVADYYNNQVVKLAEDGSLMYRKSGYNRPFSLSVNPDDQMVWVGDYEADRLVKLRPDGIETAWISGFDNPYDVAVNSFDSTVWATDYYHNQVVKLAPDGTQLLRIDGFSRPMSISIDPGTRNRVNPPDVTAGAAPSGDGQIPLTVEFTGSGTDDGSVVKYEWDFDGDGIYDYSSASTGDTSHTYTTAGTYSPVLRVTDNSGLVTYVTPDIIYAGPMTVLPSASPLSGNAPLRVYLGGNVTGLGAGRTITDYEWDYDGDGVFDYKSRQTPVTSYVYPTGGSYTAILKVIDDLGNQAFASIGINVTKQAPTVNNYASPTSGTTPLAVHLNSSASDSDGAIVLYEWDYDGDGIYDWFSTSDVKPYFTYKTAGTFDATIRVTDNDGLTAEQSKTITVTAFQNPPMATAAASATKGSAPLTITLTGAGTDSDGQIQTYEWDFEGDGVYDFSSTDTGIVEHVYQTTGTFAPRFRVTDADGLTATADLFIVVNDSGTPVAVANATPKTGPTPLTVNFNAMGSSDPGGSIVQYDWSFGKDVLWVADYSNDKVKTINNYQAEAIPVAFNDPYRLSVNPDGTVWVADQYNNQIVKVNASGHELVRSSGFYRPYGLSADPSDGSVWVADYNNHQVVKLDAAGTELKRISGFSYPTAVAVDPSDSSVWVANYNSNQVVKLDTDGNFLKRIDGFNRPFWVTIDSSDGAVWVADRYNNRVVKLSGNTPTGYHTGVTKVTPEARSGNSAMLFGNAAAADTGILSTSVTLDGSGDYVLIPSDAFPDMDSFTVEAWIKPSYVSSHAVFMRGNATGGDEIYFGVYNNSTLEAIVDNGAIQRFSGALNFTDGNWHHVAMTYDNATRTLSCYADGALYGTATLAAPADITFEGSHALIGAYFGGFNASLSKYFNGQIDDVRVWNTVRTAAQVAAAKDAELTGSESGLVGYWKLNDIQDTTYHSILTGFSEPLHIAVNPKDKSAWVCDYRNNQMVRVSSDCTREIVRISGFGYPHESVVNPINGTVWVADYYNNQIVLLSDTGKELKRISGFYRPTSVALAPVRPQDFVSLSADEVVSHIYPNIGEFVASLTVTDNDGNTDTDTIAVKAGTYPEALAYAYPTTGTAPLTVRFAANGQSIDGTIEYFRWDFDGNGTTDWETRISENKEFTYTQPGIYPATLTVTDNRGITDVKQVTITVLPSNTVPDVAIIADPPEGRSPLDVSFTGLATDSDGTIKKFEWDFDGNGTIDHTSTSLATVSHTYADTGTYTVKLIVTDNDGNQGIGTARVKVKEDGAPSATLQASVTHGPAALNVSFTGSGAELDRITTYEWDFDADGTIDYTSTQNGNAEHVYTVPGSYTAVLKITNDQGLVDTASIDILVTAGISASLSKESFDPTVGETIDIHSVLTAPAVVTVLVTDRTGHTIRTLVDEDSRSAGYYSDTWDGKNDSGQIMDSGAYLYVIHYETGGKKYVYDLTNEISGAIDKITPEYPASFNPFNADTNFFRYTLDRKSEITVYISPFTGGAQARIKTLLLRQPQKAGSYVLVWDGTDDAGNLVTAMSYVLAVFKWPLPENAMIINTRPVISDPLIKPAYLNPDARPYDPENQTVMSYTLSKQADVSFTIYDSLNYIVRTITMTDVPAGAGNTIVWDGKNSDGKNVTPGIYRTKLIATDANGNKSFNANALLIVFY